MNNDSVRDMREGAVSIMKGMVAAVADGMPRPLMNAWNLTLGFVIDTTVANMGLQSANGASGQYSVNKYKKRYGLYADDAFQGAMNNLDTAMDAGMGDYSLLGYSGFPFSCVNEMRRGFYHWKMAQLQHSYIEMPQSMTGDSQESNAFDRFFLTSWAFEVFGSSTSWQLNIESAEEWVERRATQDIEGQLPANLMCMNNMPTDDLRYLPWKPKLVKTEDFGWHGNGYERTRANFCQTESITFRDAEQMRKYMGRFHTFKDYALGKQLTE